ncbi:non-hydrolyzing UDP-N-acetylglucosamine 2-epimerase [Leifsonia sp. NPDC058194]|uniref:non-hydrolyzing UDP-N-acetylglucosamine 2-epimerase n=1 Tax=Leifsonia sp. NPDC058194 TaxID=3346374 RepID=UPI0036D8A9D4
MPATPHGIAIVLGTRPEMVKLAGIVHALGSESRVFHTGQHYDPALSGSVWDALGLPEPEAVLSVGGSGRAAQIASTLKQLDTVFTARPPKAVVVQGDTNAGLAGALAANALDIPLVHVEAGLRSFDRAMPEEHNRVIIDHIADLLCAPTATNVENLRAEQIPAERIVLTGNTVVEAVQAQLPSSAVTDTVLHAHGLSADRYVLTTIHRPENTDDPVALATILTELTTLSLPVVLPLHPRTRARIHAFGLDPLLEGLRVIDPVTPPEFLALAASSAVLVSDSGGVQEECSVLKRPLLVVRASTERPEVMGSFADRVLPGPQISEIVERWIADLAETHATLAALPSPYGDGSASETIAREIRRLVSAPMEDRRAA